MSARIIENKSIWSRRTLCLILPLFLGITANRGTRLSANEPAVNIAQRRELFVDRVLVHAISGDAGLKLQQPNPEEVVLVTDKPWEGNTSAYYTILQDGDLYRMYYRGAHWDVQKKKAAHPEFTCYAESHDGIHWTKPELGIIEFEGSRANNIVLSGLGTHNFTPFLDTNPNALPEARYKALARGDLPPTGNRKRRRGLFAFQSPDGIHWKMIGIKPVITLGAFDSQNLAFWDPIRELYVDYHRNFVNGVRNVMTCTSRDFVTWTTPENLDFQDAPNEHLYTNAIRRYSRADHLLIGFPTRYQPRTQQVEPIFMSSRDGSSFYRWSDAVIPITAPAERDGNRCNYLAWGLLSLPGRERELSVYASEAYYEGPDSRLRRFSFRVDGMTSLHAGPTGGSLVTVPLKFSGDRMTINFRTAPNGEIRIGLETADGKPIPGFSIDDCQPITGDSIDRVIEWKGSASLTNLAGRPIRLRFTLRKADIFSYRFAPHSGG